MKLKLLLQIPAAALMIFCLSSCDGGGGGGDDDFTLPDQGLDFSPRYDMNQLNPNALAQLPEQLIGFSDQFELIPKNFSNVSASRFGSGPWFPSQGPNNPTSPSPDEGRFQSATDTALLIRNQRYRYTTTAEGALIELFSIDTKKVVAVQGSTADRLYLDGLLLLKNAAAGDPGGIYSGRLVDGTVISKLFADVNAVLATFPEVVTADDSQSKVSQLPPPAEVRAAIGTRSLDSLGESYLTIIDDVFGYEAIILNEAVGEAGYELDVDGDTKLWVLKKVWWPLDGGAILKSRRIELKDVNSTNADLANNLRIDGSYQVVDEYDVLFLEADNGDTLELTNEVNKGATLGALSEGFSPGSPEAGIIAEGDFSLQLETLGSQKP